MKIKKFFIFIIALIVICLIGCESNNNSASKQYVQERFTVHAVVTKYNKDHWYAGYQHHYRISVEVYCEELDMTENFEETVSGMWINTPLWDLQKGDTVSVVAYKRTYENLTKIWLDHIE